MIHRRQSEKMPVRRAALAKRCVHAPKFRRPRKHKDILDFIAAYKHRRTHAVLAAYFGKVIDWQKTEALLGFRFWEQILDAVVDRAKEISPRESVDERLIRKRVAEFFADPRRRYSTSSRVDKVSHEKICAIYVELAKSKRALDELRSDLADETEFAELKDEGQSS